MAFPRLTQRHVLILCLAYFVIQVAGMLAFQLKWSKDVAIFGSFWEAGKHLDYALHPLVWVTQSGFTELNLNPPAVLPLFQLFALVDPQIGQSLWTVLSAAIYLACVWALKDHIDRVQTFWLLTLPLVYSGIGLGQIYVLLVALGVGIWRCIRDNKTDTAAILFGILVAMKPNFALWGLLAFAAGHYRPAIIAGLVASALWVVPLVLYGPEIYQQWFSAMALDNHAAFPHNVSLFAYFDRLGLPVAGIIVVCGAALALVGGAVRARPSLYDLTPVAIVAAVILSPLAWIDYIMVAVGFIVDRQWRLPMVAAAFLMYVTSVAANAVSEGPLLVWLASTACLIPPLVMLGHFVRRVEIKPKEQFREQLA